MLFRSCQGLKAVAQKSPCEEMRVIMGKESPLKLSQRGQDAREEVPMRTPKRLYAEERIIYHPELLTCLHCGDLLVPWNYLAWDKTVQTLNGLLSIATRPGRCPHPTCRGSRLRLLSAAAQRRLQIEHVNSSVKRCRIVKDRLRLWKEGVR